MAATIVIKRGALAGLPAGAAGEPLFTTDQFRLYVGSSGGNRLVGLLDKIDGTTAPTVNDDAGDGFSVGSHWIDTTADKGYVCADSTVGAAVWQQVSGTGTGGITQLTGDVTAGPGTGSQAATLANTAVSPGSYTLASITVDAKGRLTAASSGTATMDITGLTAAEPNEADYVAGYDAAAAANRKYRLDMIGGLYPPAPGGRLCGTTADPTGNTTSITTLYYTPFLHDRITLYDGTRWITLPFTETTLSVGSGYNTWEVVDVYGYLSSGVLALETLPWKSGTVTLTIASPCVVTWNLHGMSDGDTISFTTTGALPTGLAVDTIYYVRASTANTFQLTATPGGATSLNTSGTQSGTHTARMQQHRLTNLARYNGRWCKGSDQTRLYLGTMWNAPIVGFTSTDSARFLWNMYNRVLMKMTVVEATNSWAYSTTKLRQANNSTANQLAFVRGLNEDVVNAAVSAGASTNPSASRSICVAIGLDSTTAGSPDCIRGPGVAALNSGHTSCYYVGYPGIGGHRLMWLEWAAGGGDTQTWYGDSGGTVYSSGIAGQGMF